MSGVYNERLDFGAPLDRVTFSALYPDARGNTWRIDVTGEPRVVYPLVEGKGLEIEAIPLTPEEDALWREQGRAEAQERLSYEMDRFEFVGEVEVAETVVDPEEPPEEGQQPPELTLTIALLRLVAQGPHRLHFEIDPDIYSGMQSISFQLRGNDITPNVSCRTQNGSVWKVITGGRQSWQVQVYWVSGAPAHYVLTGDVIRY